MVDFTKPFSIVINGILVFNAAAAADREFVIGTFRREADQQAIWVNRLQLTVPAE
jgi:hypothetical protein